MRISALPVLLLLGCDGAVSRPSPDVPLQVVTDATALVDGGATAPDVRGDVPPDMVSNDARVDAGADTGVDAGADTGVDAGADTGVDAGADTGVDAGGVECDPRAAACDALPPPCMGGGEVREVRGACWGDCVVYTRCRPIPCDPDMPGRCPTNTVCFRTTRQCGLPVR